MTCTTTAKRLLLLLATFVVLCGLCSWPVRDPDAYSPAHATANRSASSRGGRSGSQRSALTPADHVSDDDGAAKTGDISARAVRTKTSSPALVATISGEGVLKPPSNRLFRLVRVDIGIPPCESPCGRAPPTA